MVHPPVIDPKALAAHASAVQKGVDGWRFTLQAPSYIAVMTYVDDGSIREKLYRAFNSRSSSGELDNRAITARILELRRAKAELLGFTSFADLVLEEHTGDVTRAADTGGADRDLAGIGSDPRNELLQAVDAHALNFAEVCCHCPLCLSRAWRISMVAGGVILLAGYSRPSPARSTSRSLH